MFKLGLAIGLVFIANDTKDIYFKAISNLFLECEELMFSSYQENDKLITIAYDWLFGIKLILN